MEFLLKIVLVLFLLSFMGRLFFRYVFPWWLNRFMKKRQQKYGEHFNSSRNNAFEDDEIRINNDTKKGEVNPDVGEYVDFEEVDDNPDNNQS